MLIDTSGFFCLHNTSDRHHRLSIQFNQDAEFRLTTNYILAEYVALAIVRRLPQRNIAAFSEEILADETIEIIWVDEQIHLKAVELLQKRDDKTYSLCDAVSFVVMRERGIARALTTDKHFEQEAFTRLLR